ncbi:dienelactone hydrolase family protein [Pantanalinema sp. GBBB05]|uniref:dienelactone hydrolase family protein n=1 Tax=Pantanalinema sp. GBBB05 TaxID=2604139 RepID=UPI001DD69E9E|nr:dienelactone hydrolase family protein [Pantanalinema sp. GBBB05]
MTDQTMRTEWVKVANGDLQIDAYLAEPTEPGTFPAIVVIQEIFGVNSHIRSVTERLAKAGYVAIAPAIFQRTAPGFEVGYSEADTVLGREYKDQTKADELLSDIQATIAYLQTKANVKAGGFGTIGFCFGGHVVYLAATLPEIKVTASFYGGGIATMTPGGGAPTVDRTPEIHGKLYAFFGTEDPLIPVAQIDQIEAALQQHQIDHQVFRYQAGHGFFCDQRADYRPEAAADAWTHVLQLYRDTL